MPSGEFGHRRIALRAFAIWLGIIAAETLHGIAREALLVPRVGDFEARQIAVFSGSVLILAIALLSIRWIGARSPGECLAVGGFWLVMTVAFEWILGLLILNLPLDRMLSDYDLTRGGLLPIGTLILFFAPWIACRFRVR